MDMHINDMRMVLHSNFGINTHNVRFLPAIAQSSSQICTNSPPSYVGIFGMDQEAIWQLVKTGWISTPRVTFWPELTQHAPPSYIGVFTNT